MGLNDFPAERQADTGTGVLVRMQALKKSEDAFVKQGRNADSVVFDFDHPLRAAAARANGDLAGLGASVLHRVTDQILK